MRTNRGKSTYINVLNNFKFTIPQSLVEAIKHASKSARPISVIMKLTKSQYVFWDYLGDDFIDMIHESKNVNKTLREYHENTKYASVDTTVEKCFGLLTERYIKKLFGQAVLSYKNKQYDIAVIGLISVIDGLLTSVSGDTGTNIYKRADAILLKIEDDDDVSSDEYSIVALTWTFRTTMESLCAKSDFNKKEPTGLNRHWIAHGRSKRRKKRLDCIKLINFIYGILLISTFAEAGIMK